MSDDSRGRFIGARACLFLVATMVVRAGCAKPAPPAVATPRPPPPAPAAAAPAPPPPPATCEALIRPGVLRRSSVKRTVDAGLGRWLSGGAEVDAGVYLGRFRGWIVRRLYPGDPCYRDVDVRPGDLVLRINGKPLERPEQANDVFVSLRTAPALVVELVRAGKPRTLSFSIVEE